MKQMYANEVESCLSFGFIGRNEENMMKKFMRIIMLFTICLFASVNSVKAQTAETVTLRADGNTADVTLMRPQTEGNDEILSLQLNLKIETKEGDASQNRVSFVFDNEVTSVVKTSRYHEETGILTLYISGEQNLYENDSLKLGKIVLDSTAPLGVTACVSVADDSLVLVNGAYMMQNADMASTQPVDVVVGRGGKDTPANSQIVDDTTINSEKTNTVTDTRKSQSMKVSADKLTFTVGDKAKTLKVTKAKGKVTFKTSSSKVVKVSAKGKVTPKGAGKATITVKAAGNGTYKEKTVKVSVVVRPKKPGEVKSVAVRAGGKRGTAKVSWKKVTASGYQIQYSYNKNMKTYTIVEVSKGSTSSRTLKNLASGKTIYVRVRAYKTQNKVINYGKWSKKIKCTSKIS